MALSRIDTTNMIEDVPQSKIDNNINFRNIIINGDMSIAQRGTSQASAGAGYHTVDRWRIGTGGSQVFTMSQDTDVPSAQGFAKSLKLACTTANASLSAGDQFHVGTRFEGQNLQYLKYGTSSAETLTLSFWVKSNKTGTLTVRAYAHDPSTDRSLSQYYTINSADTWEKKTLTFNGDTDSGSVIDNDNALSIQLDWFMLFGSNYTSGTASNDWRSYVAANDGVNHTVNLADSTSNYINITGVQIEASETASDFEFLPVDVNLQRCQRYYQNIVRTEQDIPICIASSWNTTQAYGIIHLYTTMRATPTLEQVTGTNYYRYYNANNSADYFDSLSIFTGTPNILSVKNDDNMTITSGQSGWFVLMNTSSYLAFTSEL